MRIQSLPSRGDARRRRRGALLTASAAALAITAAVPAVASAAWADPQTICKSCTEADGLVSFAEAPNGAAVAAWHGNKTTLASYRGPNDDAFGAPFTIASGGKPEFVRAAIGADGTAAVVTWIPSTGDQVVGRITPSQKTWARVPAPADGANAHIAVGPDGSVTTAEWVASTTTPTDQKLNVYTLPANSSTFSPATTLYSLAAPFIGLNGGFTLAGNGQGAYVAGWTVWTGVSAQTQAFASYSSNGTTWTAPEMVGAAPSTLGVVAVDPSGNALATYSAGDYQLFPAQSAYRSYLDDTWRAPTPVPNGAAGTIGFDLAGNAALVGRDPNNGAWRYTTRSVGGGDYSASQALSASGIADLAVSPAGDTLVLRWSGSSLTSSWGSTLTASALGNTDKLPGSGVRPLIGVGLDQNSNGTAVWASQPSSDLGSVFASTRPAGSGGTVTLTTSQLLTNQRISQAAVLRSNGALNALNAGLPAKAFRTSGLGAPAFGAGVPLTGTAMPAAPSNSLGYLVTIPTKSGSGGQVSLTQEQLLINQRISQAAVLRSNAVRDRLTQGLTAAQVGAGAITSANLLPGLSFGPLGANSAGTPITVPSANSGSGSNVTLSTQQLLINQRISQVAVRRSNLNIASLQAGLTQDAIAPGGISSQNVTP